MNSKMTTNSQLSTTEPKKKHTHTHKNTEMKSKQTSRTERNHRNGDHMEGCQQGEGGGRMGEKGQGIRNINGRYKIDRGRLRIV